MCFCWFIKSKFPLREQYCSVKMEATEMHLHIPQKEDDLII